jgi:hypothetical protein
MKNLILLTLVMSVMLLACSDNSESEGTVNAVAEFEIEGMVCEMGCGASLRKGLYETGFVSEVKVKYAEESTSNSIKIYFHKDNLTPTEMKKIIESLNEGQFQASLKGVEDLSSSDQKKYNNEKSKNASNSSGVKASTQTFSFPNLTELLNSLIH